MARIACGDASAFATLVRAHHRRCFQLAWRVMGDAGEAEDAVQDAFLKLWQRPQLYDPARGGFAPWLNRVVVNAALDRRRVMKPVLAFDEQFVAAPQERHDRGDIDRLMAQLPPRQRAVIALFYLEGHSMSEIAGMIDSNAKAVESLLSRGRAALRALVDRDALRMSEVTHDG